MTTPHPHPTPLGQAYWPELDPRPVLIFQSAIGEDCAFLEEGPAVLLRYIQDGIPFTVRQAFN
jgi:hypothetical protein